MTLPTDPTAADWFAVAREHLRDAEQLAMGHSWRNAYGLAGAAAECALKGRIMQHLGLNRWPTRQERRDLYSHGLVDLAKLAGLKPTLEAAVLNAEVVGLAWLVAKDFVINHRYPTQSAFPIKLGRDMVHAVGRDGLLEWLITGKT